MISAGSTRDCNNSGS